MEKYQGKTVEYWKQNAEENYLTIKSKILKSQDLITDYDINKDIENLSVAEDGVLEYDVVITQNIIPKRCLGNIIINFKISPINEF